MDYRKFYLQNAQGARFDLTGADGVYAVDPVGLGLALSPGYLNLGSGFFRASSTGSDPQRTPGFTVTFTRRSTAYAQYQALARFLAAGGSVLTLVYVPYGATEYYRDVMVASLDKTERNQLGWLECPMELRTLTPWYMPRTYQVALAAQAVTAMRYPFRYGSARYGSGRAPAYGATLQPAGDTPAGMTLTLDGEADGLLITLVGLSSGVIYGRCDLDYTLVEGDRLEWSTRPDDSYCRLIRAGDTVDLSGYLAMDTDPFFRLPVSEPCLLQLTGSGLSGSGSLAVSYYYQTV